MTAPATYLGNPKDLTASSDAIPLAPAVTNGAMIANNIRITDSGSVLVIDSIPAQELALERYGCWDDWHKGNYAFGIVIEAVIQEFKRLDPKGRSPLDPLWKVEKLCYDRIRRIMVNLVGYAYTGDFRKGRKANAQWGSIGTKYRKRKYMHPLATLVATIRSHAHAVPDEGLTTWQRAHLDIAMSKLAVSRADLDRWETKWRLEDFTDGRGREVTDPDLALACMAAFEAGGRWPYAAIMARRWLAENT